MSAPSTGHAVPTNGCAACLDGEHADDGYGQRCPCCDVWVDAAPPRCVCVTHDDGSVTTTLCPLHADTDPCLTMSRVTGRRRTGSIRRGVCSSCGHDSRRSR
jgi:hypothetical protein